MDWIDYREKLGLGFFDKEKEDYFITKIMNILNMFVCDEAAELEWQEYYNFCNDTASEMDTSLRAHYAGSERFEHCINILLQHKYVLLDFISYYIWLINSLKNNNHLKEVLKNNLIKVLDESHIQYDLYEGSNKIFLFPNGAAELDVELVSKPLEWLKDYPISRTAWIKALKEYANQTDENISEIADKFRKALETFFKEFFKVDKSLENCKSLYGSYLKEKGVPKEITSNFETLLQFYTNFINEYAKHNDSTSHNVLEYIMYQTGNIIRLLITLSKENSEN